MHKTQHERILPKPPSRSVAEDDNLPVLVVERNREDTYPQKAPLFVATTLGIAALFVGLLLVGQILRGASAQDEPEISLTPATTSVFALGRLEPKGEVISVAVPSGAGESRVETLNVTVGDEVKKNDILAVLDNERRLKAAVQVARNTGEQTLIRIARAELENRTTKSQLNAALRSAEAKLAAAKTTLQRDRKLRQQKAASDQDVEKATLDVDTLQQAVQEAKARLERYPGIPSESIDVRLVRQDSSIANSSLEQAEATLEQAYVRAPTDGRVLQINVRPGERAGQTPLLEMGATQNMMARLEVYETDLPRVHLAQEVSLYAEPLEHSLHGEVTRISRLVKRQAIVDADPAANTDARVLEVWVRLDEESSREASRFVNLQVRAELLE